ncbi:MAG: NAD(P)-dependent oxidoreductase [Spirochaetaceae bacterium]|nr:MAG: NAD(P)-dependent oxidoreductase [Spirochaetaceae bacterium]
MDMKIGVVGLGIMGKPIAANLIKADYAITVFNRTAVKAKAFVDEIGGVMASTPAEAAKASDVVITMVADSPDVEEVILGPAGVAASEKKGLTVIDMSTISPGVTKRISKRLQEAGMEMLDAPVSGGEKGAVEGTMTIFVGGREQVFKRCLPVFEAIGKTITYMGESGAGQLTKLCNQIICSHNLFSICEGLVFASKAGLDVQKLISALSGGSAQSWMLSTQAPKILDRDFRPGFFVKHEQKDLRLVLEAAREIGVSLPGTSLIHQLYNSLETEEGGATRAHISLVRAVEKLAGHEVGK